MQRKRIVQKQHFVCNKNDEKFKKLKGKETSFIIRDSKNRAKETEV